MHEVTGEEGRSHAMEVEYETFSFSPSELRFMADELLSGKRTLAETDWKFTPIGSTRMRNVKPQMEKAKLIAKAHPSARTQGFILTEKGVDWLWHYASDWAKKMYEEKQVNTLAQDDTPTTAPSS